MRNLLNQEVNKVSGGAPGAGFYSHELLEAISKPLAELSGQPLEIVKGDVSAICHTFGRIFTGIAVTYMTGKI
jgi:hypothetical protein